MISKDNAYSLIQKSGNLPTLPAILLRLLAACDNDDTPISEIANLISKDPVLSFKVLQLVNSAYYGFRYSFKGIEQAVIYLGANTIKNLAITMSVHQVFERKRFKKVKRFNISVFWYHSLMCATLAKRIAQKTGFVNIDEAYLSGLLHDIGRLILISTFPKEHESILARTEDRKNTLWAETQLLGVTHCEAGSWLMQKWKMSSTMADAILYHHESLKKVIEAFPLVKILYVSSLLSENNSNIEERNDAIDQLMGLSQTDIQEIFDGAAEEVEQIAVNLEIKVEKPPEPQPDIQDRIEEGAREQKSSSASPQPDQTADTYDHEGTLQETLTSRIKNVSLLSGFLESLAKAGDVSTIVAACEQAMSIIFNIEKVLFFLTDKDNILLKGHTSPTNSLQQMSEGLTLTIQQSSSLIVQTYHAQSMCYLQTGASNDNLADEQILAILGCNTVLLVPLVAGDNPAGVILLGLPAEMNELSSSDKKLVQVVAQQVGLCLQLERIKEQEKEALEAERMAAISMTARKVAHEINNPLGIISNYIASMKLKLPADGAIQDELTIIDEEIHRMSSMIGQLDNFSQKPAVELKSVDVNTVIDDIVQFVKSAHFSGSKVTISFLPDTSLPHINSSKDAMKQILLNLLKNAAEAMGDDGGEITVRTKQQTEELAKDGKWIEIVVSDNGPGLPEKVMANMYTPFVTTKQNGHSGLGLSIVRKIVTDLGGKISFTSNKKEGTSFSIFLPNTE